MITRALLTATLLSSACLPELPPCDRDAALQVVYLDTGVALSDDNGLPMYEGQAILHASCGGTGRCHSQTASGRSRYGAPVGIELDIAPRCIDGVCDAETSRFARARESILAHARLMHAAIDRGSMPPGRVGRAVLEASASSYALDADALEAVRDGAALRDVGRPTPSILDADGRAAVANWLACGAPVVELAATPQGGDPGTPCAYSGDVGECMYRLLVPMEAPEPTFDSLYESYLRPACVHCHGGGPGDRRDDSALDLSTADVAYAALLAPAAGSSCGGSGARVVPGDAGASLLLDKLGAMPSCGEAMGGTRGAPSLVLDAIRTWIDRGAAR